MKKSILILAAGFLTTSLWSADLCVPEQTSVIDAEVHCIKDGGISIAKDSEEDGITVSCMEDSKVKQLCGPDGRITRLRAYTEWFGKLKQFEDQCAADGGTFAYQDPTFSEPKNESFCLQAVPEVNASMFEEPLCNYRSICPAVAVVCERSCDHIVAKLF
jgi:hypothetical protein